MARRSGKRNRSCERSGWASEHLQQEGGDLEVSHEDPFPKDYKSIQRTPFAWLRPGDLIHTGRYVRLVLQVDDQGKAKPVMVCWGKRVFDLVERSE